MLSAAIMVVPEPRERLIDDSPRLLLLTIGRRMHSTGFCVP